MVKRTLEKMLFRRGFTTRILNRSDEALIEVNKDNNRYFVLKASDTIKVGLFIDFKKAEYQMFSYDMNELEMLVLDCPLNWSDKPMQFYVGKFQTKNLPTDVKEHLKTRYNLEFVFNS